MATLLSAHDVATQAARPSSPAPTPPTTTSPTMSRSGSWACGSSTRWRRRGAWSSPDPRPRRSRSGAGDPPKEHPLVWTHLSGRRSLVLGATTECGRDGPRRGPGFLDDLLDRAGAPEHVYRHEWAVGDLVIWDNTGVLHRALPYDATSPGHAPDHPLRPGSRPVTSRATPSVNSGIITGRRTRPGGNRRRPAAHEVAVAGVLPLGDVLAGLLQVVEGQRARPDDRRRVAAGLGRQLGEAGAGPGQRVGSAEHACHTSAYRAASGSVRRGPCRRSRWAGGAAGPAPGAARAPSSDTTLPS